MRQTTFLISAGALSWVVTSATAAPPVFQGANANDPCQAGFNCTNLVSDPFYIQRSLIDQNTGEKYFQTIILPPGHPNGGNRFPESLSESFVKVGAGAQGIKAHNVSDTGAAFGLIKSDIFTGWANGDAEQPKGRDGVTPVNMQMNSEYGANNAFRFFGYNDTNGEQALGQILIFSTVSDFTQNESPTPGGGIRYDPFYQRFQYEADQTYTAGVSARYEGPNPLVDASNQITNLLSSRNPNPFATPVYGETSTTAQQVIGSSLNIEQAVIAEAWVPYPNIAYKDTTYAHILKRTGTHISSAGSMTLNGPLEAGTVAWESGASGTLPNASLQSVVVAQTFDMDQLGFAVDLFGRKIPLTDSNGNVLYALDANGNPIPKYDYIFNAPVPVFGVYTVDTPVGPLQTTRAPYAPIVGYALSGEYVPAGYEMAGGKPRNFTLQRLTYDNGAGTVATARQHAGAGPQAGTENTNNGSPWQWNSALFGNPQPNGPAYPNAGYYDTRNIGLATVENPFNLTIVDPGYLNPILWNGRIVLVDQATYDAFNWADYTLTSRNATWDGTSWNGDGWFIWMPEHIAPLPGYNVPNPGGVPLMPNQEEFEPYRWNQLFTRFEDL